MGKDKKNGNQTMKAVYLEDACELWPFEEYNNPLFKDIDNAMQLRNEDAQADFIMDLALLRYGLEEENPHRKTIETYIQNYLMPMDMDEKLDRQLFEKRFEKLEERKMKRIYIPEGKFSFENKGKHSDDWIAQRIGEDAKTGSMDLALASVLRTANGLERYVKEAYTQEELQYIKLKAGAEIDENYQPIIPVKENALETFSNFNIGSLLENMSEEDAKVAQEGLYYVRAMNGHTYSAKEKAIQAELTKKDKESNELVNLDKTEVSTEASIGSMYQYNSDMDLSFITDYNTYKEIKQSRLAYAKDCCGENWVSNRPQDVIMDQLDPDTLAEKLDVFSQNIKSVSGSRRMDSPQFNTIKDDLKILQTSLKKGNRKENLENIKMSLESLSRHCQDYLVKTAKSGHFPRGKQRKIFVNEIKAEIDAQYKRYQEIENEVTNGRGFDKEPDEWVIVDKEVAQNGHTTIKTSYKELTAANEKENSMLNQPNASHAIQKPLNSQKGRHAL